MSEENWERKRIVTIGDMSGKVGSRCNRGVGSRWNKCGLTSGGNMCAKETVLGTNLSS